MCKNKILRLQILIFVIPLLGLCAAYFTVVCIAGAVSLGLSMIGAYIGVGVCIACFVWMIATIITLANLTPNPNETTRHSPSCNIDPPGDKLE